jgi:hypothetical protein
VKGASDPRQSRPANRDFHQLKRHVMQGLDNMEVVGRLTAQISEWCPDQVFIHRIAELPHAIDHAFAAAGSAK